MSNSSKRDRLVAALVTIGLILAITWVGWEVGKNYRRFVKDQARFEDARQR